jgi:hypothetical protein
MAPFRCKTAEAAARILDAVRKGDASSLRSEMDHAAGVCGGPWPNSHSEERAEALEAVVGALRERLEPGGALQPLEAQLALLRHLAGVT